MEVSGLDFLKRKVCTRMWRRAILSLVVVSMSAAAAFAQESKSEISVEGTGFYTKDANGQGIRQRASDTGGFIVGYRYHLNRWLSAETNYGFARNTQEFSLPVGLANVQSSVHQFTGDIVFSVPAPRRLRVSPYVLAGAGGLLFSPTDNNFVTGATNQARAAFVYGGGADFLLNRHLSLRAEYRGLLYKAPDFGLAGLNTDVVTHTAQPAVGFVVHF